MNLSMFNVVLVLHIVSGFLGLISGTVAIFANKNLHLHKKVGRIFFYAMACIFITSVYMSIVKSNIFLFLIGFFSFFLAATGYRILKLKALYKTKIKPQLVDVVIFSVGLLAGAAMYGLAAYYLFSNNGFAYVLLVFGSFSLLLGLQDYVKFYKTPTNKWHWVRSHGMRMTGAYISTITAFLVVNVSIQPSWLIWLLPTVVVAPIGAYLVKGFVNTKLSLVGRLVVAVVVMSTVVSSCAYNSKFLAPTKYAMDRKQVTLSRNGTDSTVAKYNDSSKTPRFYRNDTLLDLNYTIESVFFKSNTGATLNGWMLKPEATSIKATIVYFHGNGGSILGQYKFILPMVKHGFQIFVVDYTGYGFSTGTAKRQHLPKDALSTIDYIKTRKDCSNKKIVVYGQSYGAHLVASIAKDLGSKTDAVVIEGGFSNHKDLGSNGAKPFIKFMSRLFIKEFYAGTKLIRKNKLPLLIVHSKEDETIPYWMGEKLYKNAGGKKELYTIDGKHLMGPAKYGKEITEKILAMLQ
jgi:uncharacterized protein